MVEKELISEVIALSIAAISCAVILSALPPKADIRQRIEHVCFVPKADTVALVTGALASCGLTFAE
jgi:hypothetical protein